MRLGREGTRSGKRKQVAEFLGCHSTHVSQIVKGSSKISIENAVKLNSFFQHDPEEADYFVLLSQYDAAGSVDARNYFKEKIESIRLKKNKLSEIARGKELAERDISTYYSSWQYAAVHMALLIDEKYSIDKIASKLQISSHKVGLIVQDLIDFGLVEDRGGCYSPTTKMLHLKDSSVDIIRHHTTWRNRAALSIEERSDDSLHYSSVAAMSLEDVDKFKQELLRILNHYHALAEPSRAEELVCFCFDYFKL